MLPSEVAIDAFPMVVTTPGGIFRRVRLVVAAGRAALFESQGAGVQVVRNVPATEPHVNLTGGAPWSVQTDEGSWSAVSDQHCGCGNLLRAVSREYLLGLVGVGQ